MGESLSKAVEPEQLAEFKKILASPTSQYDINIPELSSNRRPTDRKFLFLFIGVVVLLIPFLIYALIYSDINRLFGYDPCGNVCGKKNHHYDAYDCSGKDYTLEKYLQYDRDIRPGENGKLLTPRHCVTKCKNGETPIFRVCTKSNSSQEIDTERQNEEGDLSSYLNKNAWKITLACFLSLGIAMVMLFLFRTATAALVWSILGGVLLMGAIFIGGLWYLYLNAKKEDTAYDDDDEENKQVLMIMAIIFSISWLVLFFVIVFMFRKIQLVIQLLKEATKATFDMPTLMFVPIFTFFAELIIVTALVVTSAYIFSAGTLTNLQDNYLYYKKNGAMIFTIVFNFCTAFWVIQFVTGIQYMVIGGAVSKWYFARDKNNLDSPISWSLSIVFKFHLGSIALGSMIITLAAILRALLTSLAKNKNLKACVDACLKTIETFIKYLSKNSYILTAMHGKPFFKSGKRAAKIIFQNIVNIVAINYIGDFILGMAQLLIVIISMLITLFLLGGAHDENAAIIYVIVFLVSLVIAVTSFSVFESCVDTIFLCFCEDSLLNDGMARPYAMSRNLMEFIENSKKIYGEKK